MTSGRPQATILYFLKHKIDCKKRIRFQNATTFHEKLYEIIWVELHVQSFEILILNCFYKPRMNFEKVSIYEPSE